MLKIFSVIIIHFEYLLTKKIKKVSAASFSIFFTFYQTTSLPPKGLFFIFKLMKTILLSFELDRFKIKFSSFINYRSQPSIHPLFSLTYY